jgi:hypothetical protein
MDIGQRKFERKPDGVILVDGIETAHTKQCCHCGKHFVSVKGSGMIRGFCLRCHKITCGNPNCDPCIPFEEKILAMERVVEPL